MSLQDKGLTSESRDQPVGLSNRWRLALVIASGLALAAWSGFAWGMAPRLIRAANAGQGPSALDVDLDYWLELAPRGFCALLLLPPLTYLVTSPRFARRFVGRATPDSLGAIRILTSLILLYTDYAISTYVVVTQPGSKRVPMGVMDALYALPGFESVVTDRVGLATLEGFTVMALLAAALGWRTRLCVPLACSLSLVYFGVERSFNKFTHMGLVPIYVLFVLSFTRCGDGLSIDRLRRLARGRPVPPNDLPRRHYAWGRFAVWTVIALSYLAAGLSKLRNGGRYWWDGRNLQAMILGQIFQPGEPVPRIVPFLIGLPKVCYDILGLTSLLIEIGMFLTLVSPRARRILPAAAVAMHLGITWLMGIQFWDLVVLQAVFYNWRPIWRRIQTHRGFSDTPTAAIEIASTPEPGRYFLPIGYVALVGLLSLTWVMQIELYPFTSMQMFSGYSAGGVVEHCRVVEIDEQGRSTPARLDQLGLSGHGRRRFLLGGFRDPAGRLGLTDALVGSLALWNGSASADDRIKALEVRLYRWDYLNDRENPEFGRIVDRIRVEACSKEP